MMRKSILFTALATLMIVSCKPKSESTKLYWCYYDPIEDKVESVLKKMTLDEKIGQMLQLNLPQVGHTERNGKFVVDDDKLEEVIGKYKVGSLLNTPQTVPPTPQEWAVIVKKIQDKSMEVLGIPCLIGLDQNHGTTYTSGGILFPQNINMAATFNRSATRRAAEITAYETRASNVPWTFCPTLDLSRNQLWSRCWENFGEDAFLNAAMGASAVEGFQGNPNGIDKYHISVSLKHYMGYGVPVSGKDRTPAVINPMELREKYFQPYLAGISAGALNVMVNSGMVNGVMTHANHELLTVWLKEETGWDGMIITDWADIDNLYNRDKVAKDKKDAIRQAINAGIDMSMDPYSLEYCDLLKELVEEGAVPMSRIDDAVRRIIRMKIRLGLFDQPFMNLEDYPDFGSAKHAEVALHTAEESMVLLKNDGILPLKKGTKILLTGPNANSMRCLDGGWSYSWQGDMADICAAQYNTIYEAFVNKFGAENVILEQGVRYTRGATFEAESKPEIEKAVAAARKADVIGADEWPLVASALDAALAQLMDYRATEGKALYADVTSRVAGILGLYDQVEALEGERIVNVREKFDKALADLAAKPDPSRFEQEMIFYLEKYDINEEKVRLRQHCKYFMETIDGEPYPGKKLGFILQEMGREINTTGSKANHAGIQQLVVRMKDELEKVREQSMNIL